MKKLVAVIVLFVGFAFTANAQKVKTVALEQTKGEFTQKKITFSEGIYIFEISNNAPGTMEFLLGSISAALYLLLKVSLKSFKLIFFKKILSLHLLFI